VNLQTARYRIALYCSEFGDFLKNWAK
jgi:hypothetical protein